MAMQIIQTGEVVMGPTPRNKQALDVDEGDPQALEIVMVATHQQELV
jgi:hypothetical protein